MDENGFIIEPEELNQEYEGSQFMIITYDVISDSRLTDFQKLLFAFITGLCRQNGYCWASNSYFEKFFNKSTDTIIKAITKLVELGYLKRELVYRKKVEKDGKKTETKQVSFRKLFVVIDKSNNTTGSIKNNTTGSIKNNTEIDNPLIDNPTYNILSKDKSIIGVHAERGTQLAEGKDLLENNNKERIEEVLDEVGKQIGTDGIDIFSGKSETVPKNAAKSQPPKKKGKGGLAPLYDMVDGKFPKEKYEDVNKACKGYLKLHIGGRHLPSEEKWKDMLEFLEVESSIAVAGTSGKKFMPARAMAILGKAIQGKDGIPYPDFDRVDGGLREPTVETNQRLMSGF